MTEEKKPKKPKDLASLLTYLQKEHGATAVGRLRDMKIQNVPVIPSGSLALDKAMGCGGYPRGRIIEIFGPESSGKTTLTLEALANVQNEMEQVAFIDAEHALDLEYAKKVGVDVDSMIFSQPDNGEQALEIAENLAESGEVSLIVVDSVAALTPKAEIEGEMGQLHVGLQARLMSQACRKLVGVCKKTNTTVIFINQLRHKIGVIYGSPETTPGGNALKFYASMRLDVRRRAQVKDAAGEAHGNTTEVKVVKNKMAPPFQEASFEIRWGHGIDKEGDLLNVGVGLGVVEKSGAWLSFEGERLGQGFNNASEVLRTNATYRERIAMKVRAKLTEGK